MRTTHRPRRHLAARALVAAALCAATLAPAVATASTPPTQHPASDGSHGSQRSDWRGAVVTRTASDADDVDGRLDIQRVRDRVVEIDPSHNLVSYRIRTYTPFATDRLEAQWRNFDLELDRDGMPGSERTVMVVVDDGVLEAQIVSTATREVVATVSATRPNDRAVEISGPRRLLGARSYFVTSNWHAEQSPRCGFGDGFPITCQDSAPDAGWLRLDRSAWPRRR